MTFSHDGSMQGNIGGGTYAIFDVATSGSEPPATGVTGLTATLMPGAQVALNWGYGDDSLLNVNADRVHRYWCAGADCDALTGTAMPSLLTTKTSWTLVGTDAETYTVVVQTENGNKDVVTGAALTGGGASITVTADGSVSPTPILSNAAAAMTSTDDGLTFTWDATDTGDVSSWVLCWDGTQSLVEDEFDSLLGNSCAESADTTTSLTVTEQTMCGGTCNADIYFGIAGKDVVGNVADPGALLLLDMSDGLVKPPVVTESDEDGDGVADDLDDCPTTWGDATSDLGCPDSDGDGWADFRDDCPNLWGDSSIRDGCPDSDGDEVIDPEDDCPEEAGTSTRPVDGCPDDDEDGWANTNDAFPSNANEWNDADMDNVGDNSDQCPNSEPGEKVNSEGCKLADESNLLMYTAVGGGGLIAVILLFFMLTRMMSGMNSQDTNERVQFADDVWQEEENLQQVAGTEFIAVDDIKMKGAEIKMEGPAIVSAPVGSFLTDLKESGDVQQSLGPEPSLTGTIQPDGFEYAEWPAGSGDWWHRANAEVGWVKWEK
jgi:hypothetical protein